MTSGSWELSPYPVTLVPGYSVLRALTPPSAIRNCSLAAQRLAWSRRRTRVLRRLVYTREIHGFRVSGTPHALFVVFSLDGTASGDEPFCVAS